MDQRRLGILELHGDVSRQAEIRVLVYRAWDEARNVALRAEDVWERVGEGRCSLDRGKVNFTDVVAA